MMQDFIFLSSIIAIRKSSHFHQWPSPFFLSSGSCKICGITNQTSSEIINKLILWQYSYGSHLCQLWILASLCSQEKCVLIKNNIKNVKNVPDLNICHCYYTLTSFYIPIFCLFLLGFFLLSSGKKQTRIWAFFVTHMRIMS